MPLDANGKIFHDYDCADLVRPWLENMSARVEHHFATKGAGYVYRQDMPHTIEAAPADGYISFVAGGMQYFIFAGIDSVYECMRSTWPEPLQEKITELYQREYVETLNSTLQQLGKSIEISNYKEAQIFIGRAIYRTRYAQLTPDCPYHEQDFLDKLQEVTNDRQCDGDAQCAVMINVVYRDKDQSHVGMPTVEFSICINFDFGYYRESVSWLASDNNPKGKMQWDIARVILSGRPDIISLQTLEAVGEHLMCAL